MVSANLLIDSLQYDNLYKSEIPEIKYVDDEVNDCVVVYHSQLLALIEDIRAFIGEIQLSPNANTRPWIEYRILVISDRVLLVMAFAIRAEMNIKELNYNDLSNGHDYMDRLARIYSDLQSRVRMRRIIGSYYFDTIWPFVTGAVE